MSISRLVYYCVDFASTLTCFLNCVDVRKCACINLHCVNCKIDCKNVDIADVDVMIDNSKTAICRRPQRRDFCRTEIIRQIIDGNRIDALNVDLTLVDALNVVVDVLSTATIR
jgi:hypothetical protein